MNEPRVIPSTEPPSTDRQAWLVTVGTLVLVILGAELGLRTSAVGRGIAAESLYAAKASEMGSLRAIDVLFTGDSRFLHGIDPTVIERVVEAESGRHVTAYDAALSGAPPMAQLAMILRALDTPRPPRVVVMGISPYMFGSRIDRNLARESLHTVYRVRDVPEALEAGASIDDAADIVAARTFFAVRFRPRLLEILLHGAAPGAPASTGVRGFVALPPVAPAVQRQRAAVRAEGYEDELARPGARFGNEHQGYFELALRLLRRRGIATIVVDTFSSSAVERSAGPGSIYPDHRAYVRRVSARYGAEYVDLRRPPVLEDDDFVDGDHLSGGGAGRVSAYLARRYLVPRFGGPRTALPEGCRRLFDFERDLNGFAIEGLDRASVRTQAAHRPGNPAFGFEGGWFLTTARPGDVDGPRGSMTSPPFVVRGTKIRLRIGGGSASAVRAEIVVDGRVVARARGRDDERLAPTTLDVTSATGRTAVLRIVDESTSPWGHLHVDDVATCR
ncbi:MAG: hypothetical protein U0230_06250 [Polyangiales bacterium]